VCNKNAEFNSMKMIFSQWAYLFIFWEMKWSGNVKKKIILLFFIEAQIMNYVSGFSGANIAAI
jgi:hypothetical protein